MKLTEKIAIAFIRLKLKMIGLVSKRRAAKEAFNIFCTPFTKSKPRPIQIFNKAAQLHFTLNNKRINGYRWNAEGKTTILILHGFGSASFKFHQYILTFVDNGLQVLAFDAPAHGNSEGKMINALEYRNMILEVVKLYGPVNYFMAHSFGGIAISLAIEQIPHDAQTKIVLIAPATETTSAADSAFKVLGVTDEKVKKAFHQLIYEISGKETTWFSISRAIHNSKAQTLWFHDEDDDTTPLEDALKVKELGLPNVEFVITKGLGHKKIYNDPDVKKRVTDFFISAV